MSTNTINTGTDISGLTPNTTYNFNVYPINSNGVQYPTPTVVSFTTLPILTYAALSSIDSSNQITVKWNGTYSSASIEYSSDSGSSYTTYGSYTTSPQAVKGLPSPNQQYYFKITPVGGAGNGTPLYITDNSSVTLGHISALSASVVDNSSIILSWSGSYNSVAIFYGNTKTNTSYNTTILSTATPNTTQLYDLSTGTQYYFNVFPYNIYSSIGPYRNVLATTQTIVTTYTLSYTASNMVTITTGGSTYYNIIKCLSNNTISFNTDVTSQVLLVGGGGGGGASNDGNGAGGGGGGGVGYGTINFKKNVVYNLKVGLGGIYGANRQNQTFYDPDVGGNTIITDNNNVLEYAYGGGRGISSNAGKSASVGNGGCTGGGSGGGSSVTVPGETIFRGVSASTSGYSSMTYVGYSGGSGSGYGGGGGGAGGAGSNKNGGSGYTYSITGSTYAGGGGGGSNGSGAGTGGSGGGGAGGTGINATSGTANTGGGGGGSYRSTSSEYYYGGSGGSGIIVLAFN